MAKSEASKKWDREHLTIVACRISKEKKAQFETACQKLGVTKNAVLTAAVNETIKKSHSA